jgi:hypothetical protein
MALAHLWATGGSGLRRRDLFEERRALMDVGLPF